jgi:hypothetical protein
MQPTTRADAGAGPRLAEEFSPAMGRPRSAVGIFWKRDVHPGAMVAPPDEPKSIRGAPSGPREAGAVRSAPVPWERPRESFIRKATMRGAPDYLDEVEQSEVRS